MFSLPFFFICFNTFEKFIFERPNKSLGKCRMTPSSIQLNAFIFHILFEITTGYCFPWFRFRNGVFSQWNIWGTPLNRLCGYSEEVCHLKTTWDQGTSGISFDNKWAILHQVATFFSAVPSTNHLRKSGGSHQTIKPDFLDLTCEDFNSIGSKKSGAFVIYQ